MSCFAWARGAALCLLLFCAASVLAEDSEQAVRDFNAAAAMQNAGLYQRAAERWQQFAQKYPQDARLDQVYTHLGVCQLQLKQYAAAVQSLEAVLSRYPNTAGADRVRYNLGLARYRAAGESKRPEGYRKAADAMAVVAAQHPQSPHAAQALYFQAESLVAAGDPKAAVEAYKRVVSQYAASPIAADALYGLGVTLQDLKQHSEAAAAFQAFLGKPELAKHDLATEVKLRLAISLFRQTKHAEAERLFGEVAEVRDFPNADFALLRRGQCLMLAGKTEESAKVLEPLSGRFPNSKYKSEAQFTAGKCYAQAGKWGEARRLLEPVAKSKERESPEAGYWLGRALLKLDKPQEALAAIENATRLQPSAELAPYLLLAKADALFALPDRRKEARPIYEQFLAANRAHALAPAALCMAASAALGENDCETARRHSEAFLNDAKLASHELIAEVLAVAAEAHRLLAAQGRGGDVNKAEQFYRQCLAKQPTEATAARASYGLAATCFARNNPGEAVALLDRLLAGKLDATAAARARYLRGVIHQQQKRHEPAVQDLQAFLATNPQGEEALHARFALALSQIGLKQFDQASASVAAILQQKADYPHLDKAYYELGHALLAEKKPAEAAAAFRTLAEKFAASPLAAESWFQVGRVHEDQADRTTNENEKSAAIAKAAEAYTAGLSRAAAAELKEKLRYKLADMQFRQKQFDRASATLQAQLQEHPSGSLAGPARFLAAESLFRQDKFAEALPLFAQVADQRVEPYRAQARYRAGSCAAALKDWKESQNQLEALLKEFPQFEPAAEARYGLALAMQNQNRPAEAGKLYEQVLKEAKGETAAKAQFMLGEIAFGEKKHEDALAHFLTVAAGYPFPEWQALAQYEAARCFISLGKRDKAIEALKTVVEKYPDQPKAKEAARLIQDLK